MTCEAHIDEAKGVCGHPQLQRFVWSMPSLGGPVTLHGGYRTTEGGTRSSPVRRRILTTRAQR